MSEGKAPPTDVKNAKQLPKVYYCRHMQAGVAAYDDEVILVDNDDLKKFIPSFAGKPVYVFHQTVDVDNIQEADGFVADCFYNELDGWLWSKFIAVSDEAHQAIERKWSVSNAYRPTEWGGSGTHHNVNYDRKIVNGEFTHLAIVPNPRYEQAAIFTPDEFKAYQEQKQNQLKELHNSKGTKKMFKLFKNTKEEVTAIDADTMVELENGKSISVQEMINAVKKNEDDKKKEDEKVNMDMEIEVGDTKMPLKELVNKYNTMCKANAEEDDKKKADDEEKENALKIEEEAKKAEELVNAKHFDELKNAPLNAAVAQVRVETAIDRLQRGKERYSLN